MAKYALFHVICPYCYRENFNPTLEGWLWKVGLFNNHKKVKCDCGKTFSLPTVL